MSTANPIGSREAQDIYRAWRFGETIPVIAARHNRSERSVNEIISRMTHKDDLLSPRRKRMLENIAYPNIARWMHEHGKTVSGLAREIGISETTIRIYLGFRTDRGKDYMPKHAIDSLLALTGMTYERAFLTRTKEEAK